MCAIYFLLKVSMWKMYLNANQSRVSLLLRDRQSDHENE